MLRNLRQRFIVNGSESHGQIDSMGNISYIVIVKNVNPCEVCLIISFTVSGLIIGISYPQISRFVFIAFIALLMFVRRKKFPTSFNSADSGQ